MKYRFLSNFQNFMIEVLIDLHDHEGVLHNSIQPIFSHEATLNDLKKQIHSGLRIKIENQQLFFEDHRKIEGLPEESLQFLGIADCSTIFVKHNLLDKWCECLANCEHFNILDNNPLRIDLAHRADEILEKLDFSKFFSVYVSFFEKRMESLGSVNRFLEELEQKPFKLAATKFFSEKFPNSEKIDFKPKELGSRDGIIVVCENEQINYFMKTFHRESEPHLLEMLAYRILELIGVGPMVFFPFYEGAAYILTKEICDFKELDKLEDGSVRNKVVVEAYLLLLILGIRDLHEFNIGVTTEDSLSIVDFYVPNIEKLQRREILEDFRDRIIYCLDKRAKEILVKIGAEERMRIAKNILPQWFQINNIEVASDVIGGELQEMLDNGVNCATDEEDGVEKYLQDIKWNYASLCSAFQ